MSTRNTEEATTTTAGEFEMTLKFDTIRVTNYPTNATVEFIRDGETLFTQNDLPYIDNDGAVLTINKLDAKVKLVCSTV